MVSAYDYGGIIVPKIPPISGFQYVALCGTSDNPILVYTTAPMIRVAYPDGSPAPYLGWPHPFKLKMYSVDASHQWYLSSEWDEDRAGVTTVNSWGVVWANHDIYQWEPYWVYDETAGGYNVINPNGPTDIYKAAGADPIYVGEFAEVTNFSADIPDTIPRKGTLSVPYSVELVGDIGVDYGAGVIITNTTFDAFYAEMYGDSSPITGKYEIPDDVSSVLILSASNADPDGSYMAMKEVAVTEATEPEYAYDRTAFLGGMAMGLCGKGDPIFTASDTFTKGYKVGAALRRKRVIPETTPSANGDGYALYNGVKLPNIDTVWTDKESYPYAVIRYVMDYSVNKEILTLFIMNKASVSNASGNHGFTNIAYKDYTYDEASLAWVFDAYGDSSSGGFSLSTVVWTSYDLNDYDGSVYLAASDPIPLDGYTVIEWDGNTEGLDYFYDGSANVYKIADYASADDALVVMNLVDPDSAPSNVFTVFDSATEGDGSFWGVLPEESGGAVLALALDNIDWGDGVVRSGIYLYNVDGLGYARLIAYKAT